MPIPVGAGKMNLHTLQGILDGNTDCGLGLCLQCTGEFKYLTENAGKGTIPPPVNYACVMVAIPGSPSTVGSCYAHLQVRKPASILDPRGPLSRLPQIPA